MLSTPAFGKPRPACLATNEAIAYAEAIDSLPLAHSTTVARPMTLPPRTRASEAVDPEGHLTPYLELANSPTIHTETKRLYDEAFRLMAERDLAAKRYEFLAAKKSPADPVQHAKDLAAAEAAYFQKRAEYDANQRLLDATAPLFDSKSCTTRERSFRSSPKWTRAKCMLSTTVVKKMSRLGETKPLLCFCF